MSSFVCLEVTFAETSTIKTQCYEEDSVCSCAPAWFEHGGHVMYDDLRREPSEKFV